MAKNKLRYADLQKAMQVITKALNRQFFDITLSQEIKPHQAIEEMCRELDLPFRKIILEKQWFKKNSGPLLCFDKNLQNPMALVYRRGRYRINGKGRLDRHRAAALDSCAFEFYPFLPHQPVPWKIFRNFSFDGCKKEILGVFGFALTVIALLALLPIYGKYGLEIYVINQQHFFLFSYLSGALLLLAGLFTVYSLMDAVLLRVNVQIDAKLERAFWYRLFKLPMAALQQFSKGDLKRRVSSIRKIREILNVQNLSLGISGICSSLLLWQLAAFSKNIALLTWGILTLGYAYSFYSAKKNKSLQLNYTLQRQDMSQFLQNGLNAIEKIHQYKLRKTFFLQWQQRYVHLKNQEKKISGAKVSVETFFLMMPFLNLLGISLILLHSRNQLEIASFFGIILCLLIITLLKYPTMQFLYESALKGSVTKKQLMPLLSQSPARDAMKKRPQNFLGKITVDSVTLCSCDGRKLLRETSLELEPGQLAVFTGAPGTGKTTMLRMLLGLENPTEGLICYDHLPLQELDLSYFRRHVGSILPSSRILQGSIRDNVLCGRNCDSNAFKKALEESGFAETVAKLPMGLNTWLINDGYTLSSTERMRLLLARALLNSPPILYFDSPLMILDAKSRSDLLTILESQKQCTKVIVSNDQNMFVRANCVYTFEEGHVYPKNC